jgi:hypothetical protein
VRGVSLMLPVAWPQELAAPVAMTMEAATPIEYSRWMTLLVSIR